MLPWTSWSMQRSFWLAKGLVHLWRGRLLSLGMPVPAWLTALRCHCCRAMGSTSSAYSWHLLFPTEQSFCFLWCKMCALLPWILAVNIGICLHLFRLWFGGGNGVLSLSFFFFLWFYIMHWHFIKHMKTLLCLRAKAKVVQHFHEFPDAPFKWKRANGPS